MPALFPWAFILSAARPAPLSACRPTGQGVSEDTDTWSDAQWSLFKEILHLKVFDHDKCKGCHATV